MSNRLQSEPEAMDENALQQARVRVEALDKDPVVHPPAAMTLQAKLGLLVTFILLAVSWQSTFKEMWIRWFPAWDRMSTYPLMTRLTKGDSYYSHGPLVILTSLVIMFFIYRRIRLPIDRTRVANVFGWLLLVGSMLFHLMSVYARVSFVSGFALIGVLSGLLLLWGGWPLLRGYWLPVLLLFFMVPLPEVTISDLNFQLKGVASVQAVWITNHVFGIPTILDGSYVFLPPEPDGQPKMLIVENVCSGLRSLISLTYFASMFALVCRARGFWRMMMLAMSVPVAIFCNVIRITSLNVVAHYYGVEAAGEESWFHHFSGIMVFGIALGLLFGLEQIILISGKYLRKNWSDQRVMGFLDNIPRVVTCPLGATRPMLIGFLLASTALSVYWARQIPSQNVSTVAKGAVSTTMAINGNNYTGEDMELDKLVLTILETDDYLNRRFTSPDARTPVDLLIVFSANNRKGTHPPEVCFKGSGENIISRKIQYITLENNKKLPMRELYSQMGNYESIHLYVYKCGNDYTPDFFTQQATIFFNSLLARNTAGALIRVSVPVVNHDLEGARKLVQDAARVMLTQIDHSLP